MACARHAVAPADAAIMAEDFDALMDFYADDATLVVKPGLHVTGKDNIRAAFVRTSWSRRSITSRRGRR
jgi:ketosteroid isomerase-like protein